MNRFITFFLLVFLSYTIQAQYQSPESAVWDDVNKRYFISNAGSGTIATVDWGGRTENAWTSGLIQPKAMMIIDSTLYILDYTTMKSFNVNTGMLLKDETVPTATFMNDMCKDNENNFYITETYDNSIIKYDWKRKTYAKIALKGFIDKPNGIIFDGNRLLLVSYRASSPIQAISLPDYVVTTVLETDLDFMDGIAKDGKGNIFFSAWIDQNSGSGKVYRMKEDFSGKMEIVISNLDGPADIYYNKLNDTLVVPNMGGSWVGFYPFIDPPPTPTLISPEPGSIILSSVLLNWTASRAAKTYTIQTSDNPDFIGADSVTLIKDTTFTLLTKNECDTLFWRVKAVNTKGESDWSEFHFIIPRQPFATELQLPLNNEENVSTHPDFVWKSRESLYKLKIDTVPDFSSTLLIEVETSDTVHYEAELKSNTIYYWTVQGMHCDRTAPGDTFSFKTIDSSLPEMTELNSPDNNSIDIRLDSIEFKWSSTSYTDYYKFYLSDSENLDNIIETDSIAYQTQLPEFTYLLKSKLNCDAKYFWAVHSYNQFGFTKSETRTFETYPCLTVEDFSNHNNILIYPNPGKGILRVELEADVNNDFSIELRNAMGKTYAINYFAEGTTVIVSAEEELPSGVYFIHIINGKIEYTGKFIIMH